MRLKFKIFINLLVLFFSFEILEIKAHNTNNGGCKDHCITFIKQKGNEKKIKFLKKNERFIIEQNSCVNDSLCRG